jgi:serine-type D-Ala-D-Ala carboxypeptidase (penicillin-binding protein 5/6)
LVRSLAVIASFVLALGGAQARESSVPPPSVAESPVALLVDLGAGQVLLEQAGDRPFLPASMTKAMTTLIAFDLLAAGKLREDQVFTVSAATAQTWSGQGTSLYLKPGMQVSAADLLHGVTIASANDAAVVLAEGATGSVPNWLKLMNARAKALGMASSTFATPNGWPDGGQTKVSARDLLRLAQALVYDHPELYRRYVGHPVFIWKGAYFANHDPFAGTVPGADGIKTGHTAEAGYNFLGTVERDGRRLVVVVAGTPSEAVRGKVARDLIEWGFASFAPHAVAPAGAVVGSARVQNGAQRSVALALVRPLGVALAPGSKAVIISRIIYRGPLVAPIRRGAVVAELELQINRGPAMRFPLQASAAVGVAGPFDRLGNGLLGLWP